MKQTFEIPGPLPGLNEIIGAINRHRFVGAKLKKETTERCAWWIKSQRLPEFLKPVSISFFWHEKDKRRDLDNITAGAKFILDALVVTGRLQNDTRRWIKSISHAFPEPDKNNPRVKVLIEELSDDR